MTHFRLGLHLRHEPSILAWVLVPVILILHDKRPSRAFYTVSVAIPNIDSPQDGQTLSLKYGFAFWGPRLGT